MPPPTTGEIALSIAEALLFLRREASQAGLPDLADSLSLPIDTAARLAADGWPRESEA